VPSTLRSDQRRWEILREARTLAALLAAALVVAATTGCSPMNEVARQLDECQLAAARAALGKCTDDDVRGYMDGHPEYAHLGRDKAALQAKIGAAESMLRASRRYHSLRGADQAAAMSAAVEVIDTERWGGDWTAVLCDLNGIVLGAERYIEQQVTSIENQLATAERGRLWYEIASIEARYSLDELSRSGKGTAEIGRLLEIARTRREEAESLYARGQTLEDMLRTGACRDLEAAWGCIELYTEALEIAPELDERKQGLAGRVNRLVQQRAQIVREHFATNLREGRRLYEQGSPPSEEREGQLQRARNHAEEALCIAQVFEHVVVIGTKEAEHFCAVVDTALSKNRAFVENAEVRARRGALLRPETAGLGIPITGDGSVRVGQSMKWQGSAALPAPDHELLRPEDVFGLETDLPPGYVISYLANRYSDERQTGVHDILSPTAPHIDRSGRRHYISTDYDGGDFFLETRNSQGTSSLSVRCVVYERLM